MGNNQQNHTIDKFVAQKLEQGEKPNHLINEKSPYLLQHAFNPVDWHPWGKEAIKLAQKEHKPIFLSIGYSTCHWCHVMAHESFEDADIANLLNKWFIPIKVDREERPDIDRLYMTATQALTGGGGWPMSVFLTPDLRPFYAGTYFPPKRKYNMPGFDEVLKAVHEKWQTDPNALLGSAAKLAEYIKQNLNPPSFQGEIGLEAMPMAYEQFASIFDSEFGGFGLSPKFPQPMILFFLLRYAKDIPQSRAKEMALFSLRQMAAGGISDQIGGGFHRYSVDRKWFLPHFEKMLYDQALLALAYGEAFQLTKDEFYATVLKSILDYVQRDMTSGQGGFYSAEDADSPLPENPARHGEGAFYIWSDQELKNILEDAEYQLAKIYFGIKQNGNVTQDPHQEFAGKNILYQTVKIERAAEQLGLSQDKAKRQISGIRNKLLKARQNRPRPHLDDKIITAWNGLMISAFARAGAMLDMPGYLKTAQNAAHFITTELYAKQQTGLMRTFRAGHAGQEAMLDDYAFLIQGLIDLYEANGDIFWLKKAIALGREQTELFWDSDNKGFFETSGKDRSLLMRGKETFESAIPSGNSVALLNCLRLGELLSDKTWAELGATGLAAFGKALGEHPSGLPQMLCALYFLRQPTRQIVISGDKNQTDWQNLLHACHRHFQPAKVLILADANADQSEQARLFPFLTELKSGPEKVMAHVCRNYSCGSPTDDPDILAEQIDAV
jgi:hypothetical protein